MAMMHQHGAHLVRPAPSPHTRVFSSILPPIGIPAPPVPWDQMRPRRGLLARIASTLRVWFL